MESIRPFFVVKSLGFLSGDGPNPPAPPDTRPNLNSRPYFSGLLTSGFPQEGRLLNPYFWGVGTLGGGLVDQPSSNHHLGEYFLNFIQALKKQDQAGHISYWLN